MLQYPTQFTASQTGFSYLEYDKKNNVYHPGIDLNFGGYPYADLGQPIVSPAIGTVLYISTDGSNGGLGKYIVLYHRKLGVWTRYCHLLDVFDIHVGDAVDAGRIIGHVGGTGGFSPHLHFEVLTQTGINYIKEHWRQPYNGYFQGIIRSQVALMTLDPMAWIENTPDALESQGVLPWQKEVKEWAQAKGFIMSGWDNPTLPMSQERVAAAMKKMYDHLVR